MSPGRYGRTPRGSPAPRAPAAARPRRGLGQAAPAGSARRTAAPRAAAGAGGTSTSRAHQSRPKGAAGGHLDHDGVEHPPPGRGEHHLDLPRPAGRRRPHRAAGPARMPGPDADRPVGRHGHLHRPPRLAVRGAAGTGDHARRAGKRGATSPVTSTPASRAPGPAPTRSARVGHPGPGQDGHCAADHGANQATGCSRDRPGRSGNEERRRRADRRANTPRRRSPRPAWPGARRRRRRPRPRARRRSGRRSPPPGRPAGPSWWR